VSSSIGYRLSAWRDELKPFRKAHATKRMSFACSMLCACKSTTENAVRLLLPQTTQSPGYIPAALYLSLGNLRYAGSSCFPEIAWAKLHMPSCQLKRGVQMARKIPTRLSSSSLDQKRKQKHHPPSFAPAKMEEKNSSTVAYTSPTIHRALPVGLHFHVETVTLDIGKGAWICVR
jgi:hypothetical protein